MLMDKESAKAWGEQQAREIKNLKAMKKSEQDRIIKIIEKCWSGRKQVTSKILFQMDFKKELIRKIKNGIK